MRGAFIVFEGLDGAGTTTQARLLCEALAAQGTQVHPTREPSDGPVGVLLRQALAGRLLLRDGKRLTAETLALLFAADRRDHLAAEVEPALARGITVVCDRYLLSSLAYQGQEVDPALVRAVNAGLPAPDLTLFLRVAPEVALRRRSGRAGGDELYEALETQRRVARAYDEAVAELGAAHAIVTVDGEASLAAVTAQCLEASRRLPALRPA